MQSKLRPPQNGLAIQRKTLSMSAANDSLESEADRAADQVMSAPSAAQGSTPRPMIGGRPSAPRISRRGDGASQTAAGVSPQANQRISSLSREPGQALPDSERSFFESRFQRDFGKVRIHTNSAAAQAAESVNARAFTLGQNIAFAGGEYRPGTTSGRRLLAHELAHTVQQGPVSHQIARAPKSTPPQTKRYTVKAGDTLFALSREFGTSVDELVALNRREHPKIGTGKSALLRDGWSIQVPAKAVPNKSGRAKPASKSGGKSAKENCGELEDGQLVIAQEVLDWTEIRVYVKGYCCAYVGARIVPKLLQKNFGKRFGLSLDGEVKAIVPEGRMVMQHPLIDPKCKWDGFLSMKFGIEAKVCLSFDVLDLIPVDHPLHKKIADKLKKHSSTPKASVCGVVGAFMDLRRSESPNGLVKGYVGSVARLDLELGKLPLKLKLSGRKAAVKCDHGFMEVQKDPKGGFKLNRDKLHSLDQVAACWSRGFREMFGIDTSDFDSGGPDIDS